MMISRRRFVSATAVSTAVASAHEEHDANPAVDRVSMIHGASGPFAMAGYRMGEAALRDLKTHRGSFDLQVTHYAPSEVQWSCIIDGLQAATGASVGKLNLKLVEAPRDKVVSVVRNRKTGQEVRMALTPEFVKEYFNLPMKEGVAAGSRLSAVPEAEIFTRLG